MKDGNKVQDERRKLDRNIKKRRIRTSKLEGRIGVRRKPEYIQNEYKERT
jgi:hypothetical protein